MSIIRNNAIRTRSGLMLLVLFSLVAETASATATCATPYPDHGVNEATIVYTIDEVVEGPLFLPMNPTRNTRGYRKAAYDYFYEQFGLVFDVENPAIQVISDVNGGTANVFPLKTGAGSTHQVYAVDAQMIPAWRHKMPLNDIAFFDDGFFVTLETDFQVTGKFAGETGVTLSAGTQLVFGEYRMFDGRGRLLETFQYQSDIPVAGLPVTGNFQTSDGAVFLTIACEISSPLFGRGSVRSLAEVRPLGNGKTYLDFRYVMKFPARVADAELRRSHCKRLRPLNRRD